LCSCSAETKRTNVKFDLPHERQLSDRPLKKAVIRIITTDTSGDKFYFLRKSLTEKLSAAKLFSEFLVVEHSYSMKKETDLNLPFETLFEKVISENISLICNNDGEQEVMVFLKNEGVVWFKFSTALFFLTLGLYPTEEDYYNKVGIYVRRCSDPTPFKAIHTENFTTQLSLIPKEGASFRLTWEKEPIESLILKEVYSIAK
jgi:hypothetical protein